MKKIISLLKAIMSNDMDVFKYKTKEGKGPLNKILLLSFLTILIMFSVGSYAYTFGTLFQKVSLTYVMLSLFMILSVMTAFIEGIYKSGGILFESKDNDLLMSLPVKKSTILYARIFKLLTFEIIYNSLFLLPAFAVYAYLEHPGLNYYIISFIYLFLVPIIPTVISCFIGYFINLISSKSKSQKIIQTILTLLITLGIFSISFNMESLMSKFIENATSINDFITRVYYPVGAYLTLIDKFDFVTFIKVLLLNVVVLGLFIYIGSKFYFRIISKTKEIAHKQRKKEKIRVSSKISSLTKKELTRFLSSPIYMFNTSFGFFAMFLITIVVCLRGESILSKIDLTSLGINITNIGTLLPKIFPVLVMFASLTSSITSSSISLEGKSLNLTKSLPIKTNSIFLSKILLGDIISVPLMLLAVVIFTVTFNLSISQIIINLLYIIVVPTFTSIIGLILNLKFPHLRYSSDTEVVKQSMSVMISVFIGMVMFLVTTGLTIKFINYIDIYLIIQLIIFIIITILLWLFLSYYGSRKWKNLNI